jgi:hypothetical protein
MRLTPIAPSVGQCPSSRGGVLIVTVALSLGFAPAFATDAANRTPVKIAVFEFELEDSSPPAVLLNQPVSSAALMDRVSGAAREELTRSGRYLVIDASKADTQSVAAKGLRNCDGCEAGVATQLGAEQSLIGVISKVTATDYYVVIQIREARTGKVLDSEGALFAGDEQGWPSGVRMLIRHQVLPSQEQNRDRPSGR